MNALLAVVGRGGLEEPQPIIHEFFGGQCEVDGRLPGEGGNADIMQLRDEVLRVCRTSAEKAGRVFAIMYDVSGVPADRIEHVIKVDWVHLVRDLAVLDSPNYLREGGKPVIALWGLCTFLSITMYH